MKDYRSLPFATYDLAVYIPGGAIFLILARKVLEFLPTTFPEIGVSISSSPAINAGIELVLFLSAAYLVGHLAAFLSTYTIEKPLHNWLGYPSDIWLNREDLPGKGEDDSELRGVFRSKIKKYKFNLSGTIAATAHLPLFIQIGILYLFKPFGFYVPKFPAGQFEKIKARMEKIDVEIEIRSGTRWEKIAEHYIASNHPMQFQRMYNYLTIYGALRLLSLFVLALIWLIVSHSIYLCATGCYEFSLEVTLWWQLLSFLYLFSVMGFAKFNRRYFEESLYIFLFVSSDTDVVTPTIDNHVNIFPQSR